MKEHKLLHWVTTKILCRKLLCIEKDASGLLVLRIVPSSR